MKVIALMPVKNEDWILETTLQSLNKIADHIVVADQNSTDRTMGILTSHSKVRVIENNRDCHSNQVRWDLLDYARKNFGVDNNLVINVDADELLPPVLFNKLKKRIEDSNGAIVPPGKAWISSPWVQLWRSVNTFRNDSSVWSPATNRKPFAFVDDGTMEYNKSFVINDHTSRVPGPEGTKIVETNIPLIHFQFANWRRTQEKQAWYRCKEFVKNGVGSNTETIINQKYRITKDETNIQYSVVPKIWFEGVNVPTSLEYAQRPDCVASESNFIANYESWYVKEIKGMLLEHGKEAFAKLDIWDVVER